MFTGLVEEIGTIRSIESKGDGRKFQINAIPTLIVNDHYKTNLQMAKSEARLFEILDYLLSEVKQHDEKSTPAH